MPNFIKPQGEIATPGETETNALFHAGCIYLLGGSVGAAYDCFRQITPDRVSTLFNRALCCYRAKEYSGAFQLLAEAEQLSAHGNFGEKKTGTDALTEKLYEAERPLDGHRAPMPLVPASNRHAQNAGTPPQSGSRLSVKNVRRGKKDRFPAERALPTNQRHFIRHKFKHPTMTAEEISKMYKQRESSEAIHAALLIVPVDEECNKDWNYSCTALHLACSYVDPEGVRILLERGAKPNATDCYGRTPLYYLTQQDGQRDAPEGAAYQCAELLFAAKPAPPAKTKTE